MSFRSLANSSVTFASGSAAAAPAPPPAAAAASTAAPATKQKSADTSRLVVIVHLSLRGSEPSGTHPRGRPRPIVDTLRRIRKTKILLNVARIRGHFADGAA